MALGGCGKNPEKHFRLEPDVSVSGRLYYGSLESGVRFSCQPDGVAGLTFESPAALSGLHLSLSPAGYTAQLGDAALHLPAESLPWSAPLALLREGFGCLAETELPLRLQGESYVGEGRTEAGVSFLVTVSSQGRLEKFSIPGQELDFLLFSPEKDGESG